MFLVSKETFSLVADSECHQKNVEPVLWVVVRVYCALEVGHM